MGWISKIRKSMDAEPANSEDDTIINDASYDAYKGVQSGVEEFAPPTSQQNSNIADEVKRRQISLALRYVAAVRARAR